MKKEIWLPVVGYEGFYEVSNLGRVKSVFRLVPSKGKGKRPIKERILRQCIIRGYANVILCLNGKSHKHKLVHRIVAEAFILNSEQKPNIDHKDGNSLNNNVDNLYWCTQKENCNNPISRERNRCSKIGQNNPQFGKRNGQVHNSRRVASFTKEGEFIIVYPSVAEAERKTGINANSIRMCALGKPRYNKRDGRYYNVHSAGGYIWRYI